jgi:hypothetical protein
VKTVTEPLNPGWNIPLSDEEFKLIGQLCAIQGQVEHLMKFVVASLLDVTMDVCDHIMVSTGIMTNAQIWSDVVAAKAQKQWMIDTAKLAFSDICAIAEGRNDFVHAVFGWEASDEIYGVSAHSSPTVGPKIAIRLRSRRRRPVSDLPGVRDEAARLSRMVAHVHWGLTGDEPTPWQDTF